MQMDLQFWADNSSPQAYPKIVALTATTGLFLALKKAAAKIAGRSARIPALNATPNAHVIAEFQMESATSGNVKLRLLSKAINAASGESGNPASFTAEAYQNIAVPGTARTRFQVRFPASGSLGETIAEGDRVEFRIERDGGDAVNDTATGECEFIGATFFADDP